MMKKWALPITIVCIISGLLLSLQLKAQSRIVSNPISERNQALIEIINKLENETDLIQSQISKIREEIETIEERKSYGQEDISQLQNKVHKARKEAGLIPLEGPGVVIILDDNKAGLQAAQNDDPNRYIIHYENILNIISELKLAKAEAISINGQRIVTSSEIRCVGNVILVNTTRLAPPFEIKAIGNPSFLEDILLSGEFELLKNLGFPVSYTKHTSEDPIEIPAYAGSFQFKYIKSD